MSENNMFRCGGCAAIVDQVYNSKLRPRVCRHCRERDNRSRFCTQCATSVDFMEWEDGTCDDCAAGQTDPGPTKE